ncbi:MAG: YggS family pyridoxal phosphate-dependent enzyme [Bacteroidales bacterium]|nr:YggS family pyridoxal phosphate-dependent enzyme [Bacteroidales bacterium]MBN2756211.1 YggS family pyridoxal phosphate-dependent enzyme [Bacteroidales bacterium]
MSVKKNIDEILNNLPEQVKLVAVSKTKPNELILEAYNNGYKVFGENKVQEISRKYEELPKDIEWHMIGHLQSNKVKYIAPFVSLIHAVDSFKLLKTINNEALKNNRTINFLFQMHIAKEESKFGFSFEEIEKIIQSSEFKELKNVNLIGFMGMATNTDNGKTIKDEFKYINDCLKTTKQKYFKDKDDFKELSIGMSGDYKIAIEQGSTIIRLGSIIFGERNHVK